MKTPSQLKRRHHSGRGFTLVELAIVLIIFSLLVGGMMMSLTSQQDATNIKETEKRLNDIRDALLGFAVVNGRLPCPANPATASGAAGAGIEYAPTAVGCTTATNGVVPWATLGVPETDAWNRRLTYSVTQEFAQSTGFTLATAGNLTILAAAGGTILVNNTPAVVVSHGKNGLRAFLPDGTQMGVTADADEQENSNANATFVNRIPSPTFDDQAIWIAPTILMNRMISAVRLPK